ncbi:MAG: ABC transporter permease [Planctomycetes bacterium]|nr:ABC transporter permease [Planctomycetota bacterium]
MVSFKLVRRYLGKHKVRSILTIGSLVVALFLLCMLRSLVVALDAGVRGAKRDRLVVQSAVSLFVDLPQSYQSKIAAVEGIETICKWQWFGGRHPTEEAFFAQFAVDMSELPKLYPEIAIVEGSFADVAAERRGCVVGRTLAKTFNWQLGQTVPLLGTIFPGPPGDGWQFTIKAIYEPTSSAVDGNTLFFHWDYFEETVESTMGMTPGTGTYFLRTAPDADQVAIAGAVEQLFDNGPQRVTCSTEAEFQAQFVSMVGNVPFFVAAIGGGVLIAIVLACINTMLMAFREQLHDAGILKAVGFTDGSVAGLMLAESLLLCGLGGFGGIALAKLSEPGLRAALGSMFPGYEVTGETLLLASALTLAVGLVAGVVPALRARALRVVEALRSVE